MKNKTSYFEIEQKRITRLVTSRFKKFYLTGGTALAFYFHHRLSEDLDFFTQNYKKDEPDKVMAFISKQTRFSFALESEQTDPKLIPMKVYYLQLKKGHVLKVDFLQDFEKNLKKVKNGLHSVEDIYFRKLIAAVGLQRKESIIGTVMASGRQSTKDVFDIYYLSKHHESLVDFFLDHFSIDKVEILIAWYRSFNPMDLKLELLDLVPGVDTAAVLEYLDDEILKKLPDRIISRR